MVGLGAVVAGAVAGAGVGCWEGSADVAPDWWRTYSVTDIKCVIFANGRCTYALISHNTITSIYRHIELLQV